MKVNFLDCTVTAEPRARRTTVVLAFTQNDTEARVMLTAEEARRLADLLHECLITNEKMRMEVKS